MRERVCPMDFEHDSSLDTTQNLKKTLVEERSLWRVGGLESLLRALSEFLQTRGCPNHLPAAQ